MESFIFIKGKKEKDKMEIKEEIFKIFFEDLEKDENFPKYLIQNLKELLKNGDLDLKKKLVEIIKEVVENVR